MSAPTVADLARRDLFWKVRADPRRGDLELGTRAGVLPYFVPVGSPLGREVVVDGAVSDGGRLARAPTTRA